MTDNMIEFFVQRVIEEKTAFAAVPRKLKEAVKEHLIQEGFEYLTLETE